VVVAEGSLPRDGTLQLPEAPLDEFGRPKLGGIGHTIAHEIEERTGFPARITILGHVQRGGSPTPMDRVLATQMGVRAAEFAIDGRWGTMTAQQGNEVGAVTLAEATEGLKTVPPELFQVAEVFFG
jgi:6-phosphofructokinase 1